MNWQHRVQVGSQNPDKDPKSLKISHTQKLHDLFEMTETYPLFDISGSYVEIDGWVSLHFSSNATVSRIVAVSHDSANNEHHITKDRVMLTPYRLSSTSTQKLVPSTNMKTTTYQLRPS